MDPSHYENAEDRFKDLAFSLIEVIGEATAQITSLNDELGQKDDEWDAYVDDVRVKL